MGKVLRLHNNGTQTLEGWKSSAQYNSTDIDSIADPNASSAAIEITSIPSPFARIDLVKSAFRFVSKKDQNGNYPNVNGNTIYNKMVSDALDVAQIFFQYDTFKNKIQLIVWNKQTDLNRLIQSSNSGQQQLGQTYDLFFNQDALIYNFNTLNNIYLLNFIGGPDRLNIIGATSPATLFFSSANDLSGVSKAISFGKDRPFDSTFCPLYERDETFHVYLESLRKSIPNFQLLFPEFDDYLTACYNLSSQDRKQQLNQADPTMALYIPIGPAGNPVEVLGFPLYQENPGNVNIAQSSDFVIKSTVYTETQPPLVLPNDVFSLKDYNYVKSSWDSTIKAPFFDGKPLSQRSLPAVGNQYPYLTISDFLEDKIVRMNYKFNDKNFFDGNTADGKSYLLPLKKEFFDYFSTDQLINGIQGRQIFILRKNASGVTAELNIPIKKGFITWTRTYYENSDPDISDTSNSGSVVDCDDFAFAMTPGIRYSEDDKGYYRISLVTDYGQAQYYGLECYNKAQLIKTDEVIRNSNYSETRKTITKVIEKSNIDFVQVKTPTATGVVVPRMHQEGGSTVYHFAIDFGTTNSHIEYFTSNNSTTKSFDITENDTQLLQLCEYPYVEKNILLQDFIPQEIGKEFKFPIRTVESECSDINFNTAIFALGHINIPFSFGQRTILPYNNIQTNLKWSNDPVNIHRVRAFIENLFMMLRNKVVLNRGSLNKTKITCFYPISMPKGRRNSFKTVWEDAYKKYFGSDISNVKMMTESVAPYNFYKTTTMASANMVSVDIGGGTTDIVFAQNNNIQCITSFQFASSAVFGDAYIQNPVITNGMVRTYMDKIKGILSENGLDDLVSVISELDDRKNSSDIANCLFSLAQNADVKAKKIEDNLNYNRLLSLDEDYKIVFLFFYAAIIYHVAKILKTKNIELPRYVTFSGNGSKILSILTNDSKTLSSFTQTIIEKITGRTYDKTGVEVKTDPDNPKEATCKGGLKTMDSDSTDFEMVTLNVEENGFFDENTKYSDIKKESTFSTIEDNATEFVNFVFQIIKETEAVGNFSVSKSSLELAKDVCYQDLQDFTKSGLEKIMNGVTEDESVQETLFFYPIVGMLYNLTNKISENKC
ncbi:MAG: hypothetical protein Q4B61_09285 [Bacteroidales bacterium]|nr:hypothetical protein [Bacteroidales bacterium]